MQKEPALQLASYYDDNLRFVNNGMGRKVIGKQDANELCMEVTVTKPEECIAIIFSFVAHDQRSDRGWIPNLGHYDSLCFMEARIIRNNEEVFISHLFNLRKYDNSDQVYFCTLRRQHPFVHALKQGDKICVYARTRKDGAITVKQGDNVYGRTRKGGAITVNQGAICVVYSVLGEIHVVANGTIEGDSNVQSQGAKEKLTSSFLVDNPEIILRQAWGQVRTTTILNNGLKIVNFPFSS